MPETTTYTVQDAIGNLRALPGYPWLPCPICRGVEGCDHTVPERAAAIHPAAHIREQFHA